MPSTVALRVVALVVVATIAVLTLLHGHPPQSFTEWLAPVGPAVAVASGLLWVFDRFAWRWPGLRKLVGRPILHGTWHGELASRWVNPTTGQRVPPVPDVFLVVRQRFWHVTARLLTRESSSTSVLAEFKRADDGVCQLIYLYINTPRPGVRDHSAMHSGAVFLSAPKNRDDGLEGEYFTGRRTTGELHFHRHFKTLVESHGAGLTLVAQTRMSRAPEC